jgi:UDP-N-acetyl-D-mannosaminuronate dehydrogenase
MIKAFNLNSLKNKRILLLGVSYRSDVGDTRYSPVEPFYLNCKNDNAIIETHDPYVKKWEEVNINVNQDLGNLLDKKWDIIVFSASHTEYKTQEFISKLLTNEDVMIYDTLGLLSNDYIEKLNKKNIVKVLGRGDI